MGNSDFVFPIVGERLASDHARHVSADITEASNVLSRRLVMTGARADVPELLAAIDVFCLPSWREGMPRTIIEAMMMGKQVIVTNIRGSREEVVPVVTGFIIPSRLREIRRGLQMLFLNVPQTVLLLCGWVRQVGSARAL